MLLLAITASRLLKEEVSSNVMSWPYDMLLECGFCFIVQYDCT